LHNNLASENIHPEIIDQELLDEVAAGHLSGPFSVAEATQNFGGFFHCSPICLVRKVPGDGNW